MARTPSLPDALQQDKNETLRWMNECFHQPGWRNKLFNLKPKQLSFSEKVHYALLGKRDVFQQFTRLADQEIANDKQPYATTKTLFPDPANPISHLGFLNILGVRFKCTECETQNALLLVSYALQAYHEEHGRYPAKLSELAPGYLHAVPNDPFAANKPFRYQRTGNRYLLYSIGPDGIDNGGQASVDGQMHLKQQNAGKMLAINSTGDIVPGVNVW